MTSVASPDSTGRDRGPDGEPEGPGHDDRRGGLPRFLRVTEYHATLYSRFWKGSIVTNFVSPIFYLLAMGIGVGTLVDANANDSLGGSSYLHYVAPGLMASAAMQTAVGSSLYPILASVKWLKTAYAVIASPIRPLDMAIGFQVWVAIQMFGAATIFTAVIVAIGAATGPMVVLAPFAATLGGLAYSGLLAPWSISREGEDSFTIIMRIGILPSFLLSGTFFPIEQLPVVLRVLAAVTPLWNAVELVRGSVIGGLTGTRIVIHTAVLLAYVAAGHLYARRAYAGKLYR